MKLLEFNVSRDRVFGTGRRRLLSSDAPSRWSLRAWHTEARQSSSSLWRAHCVLQQHGIGIEPHLHACSAEILLAAAPTTQHPLYSLHTLLIAPTQAEAHNQYSGRAGKRDCFSSIELAAQACSPCSRKGGRIARTMMGGHAVPTSSRAHCQCR